MKKSLVLAMVFFLAACSGNSRMTNGQLIGSIGGGIIGTYVGSQIGAGSGNLVGYSYGDSLIPSDRAKFKEATKVAMDNIADGEVYSWVNPDSGVAGTITPVRSYHVEKDQICRDFEATISVDKRIGKTNGRACKISADAWLVDSHT